MSEAPRPRWSLTIRQRLIGWFALVMAVILAMLAQSFYGRAAHQTYAALSADYLNAAASLQQLANYYSAETGVGWLAQKAVLGRVSFEQALAELQASGPRAAEAWGRLSGAAHALPDDVTWTQVETLRATADAAIERFRHGLASGSQSQMLFDFPDLEPATRPLQAFLEDLKERLAATQAQRLADAHRTLRQREIVTIGFAVCACIFMLVAIPGGLRRLYRGIEELTSVARRLSARDFTARPSYLPAGELGELAQAFVTLQQAVAQHAQELGERELEARAASQAKSMFLASMSHEIRTPLIGVLGMLELLGRSQLDADQRRQFNIVQQSAHALLEIVGDILDYSKIEAGKFEIHHETVAVREMVARVISMFSANAQSKGLQLVQAIDPQLAAAHVADGVRLMQVLRNFVGNGIKFTETGGVTVSVHVVAEEPGGQRLRFVVADTGIGMTVEQVGRLFQPFTQADGGTARRFGGTGLGLVICRRLADAMSAAIAVDSKPGSGTAMSLEILLPRGDPTRLEAAVPRDEKPLLTRASPSREQAEAEGTLILLAEDHPINRDVLTGQLRLAGFCVDTAEDGTRALEKFASGRYGLVLTDLHMPGLDGYQLTDAIRELERTQGRVRTPVIALTADTVKQHVDRCFASGMDDYLCKPVTIRQLVEKLQHWFPQVRWDATAAGGLSAPRQGPVDMERLDQYARGDQTRICDLLDQYCRCAAADLEALEEAVRQGDDPARLAHRILGAALTVGADEVAQLARRVEREAPHPAHDLVEALSAAQRRTVEEIERYIATLHGRSREAGAIG